MRFCAKLPMHPERIFIRKAHVIVYRGQRTILPKVGCWLGYRAPRVSSLGKKQNDATPAVVKAI